MVLELHIWGPAFSLPSIDPQCLAAIVYLRRTVPNGEWVLIASSDDAQSPTSESTPFYPLQSCQVLLFSPMRLI